MKIYDCCFYPVQRSHNGLRVDIKRWFKYFFLSPIFQNTLMEDTIKNIMSNNLILL